MAVNPGFWGIDIGQCALKAIRLEQINGVVTATAFDYVEHPKILNQPDANPDELTREALEKFLSRNQIKGDQVAISVPGQSGLARFVKLPPVEEKKITDIVKFEAKQQIPFPLEEVVWDYQKISEGTVTDGFAMDTEIGLFAMKRDMINRSIGHFIAMKMEVHHVQMAPLALTNFVNYEMLKRGGPDGEAVPAQTVGKKKCVVALDIGTDGSNLVITDGARIIWQRPIPVGGNHFTRALTKELKLTFAKAEHLKRNAAKSPELANILKALRPVLQEFVGEVQRSLGYFTNTHRDAQIEYLVGLGSAFKLPGLQKFLADKLTLDVRKPAKFERISGDSVTTAAAFVDNVLSFPVAYGLAVQGLGVSRLKTNLLPPEITVERKIRAKKPYAVASAAALLLGTTMVAYGYSFPLSDATDTRIEASLKKAKGAVDEAKRVDGEIESKKKEIADTQTQVETIIAGAQERANWLTINSYVYDCVPIPGEKPLGNMRTPELEPYWARNKGRDAIMKYDLRMSKGIDPNNLDDDLREHLAMIDIEAVYCRFTKDLSAVYDGLERQRKTEIGGLRSFPGSDLAPADWWKKETIGEAGVAPAENIREELKPVGEGWVFEVRGYTYYHPEVNTQTGDFIRNTLLKNIIARSRGPKEAPTKEEDKKALEANPIIGKISHAFMYHVWEDKVASPGVFRKIGTSLIDGMIPADGAMGMGGMGGGPGDDGGRGGGLRGSGSTPGMFGPPPGMGGGGGASAGGAWRPLLGSGGVASTGGAPMAPGGLGTPPIGMFPPGMLPPGMGGGSGSDVPMNPIPPVGGGSIKVKPRYEFVIVFTWKEPTPSDKLRPIKVPEPKSGGGFGAPPGMGGGVPPQPMNPPPQPKGKGPNDLDL